jgi:hypothetical protein
MALLPLIARMYFKIIITFVVVFTRRQANGSAHALARAALSHASRNTFDVIVEQLVYQVISRL